MRQFYIVESWLTTLALDVESLIENGEEAPIEEEFLECRKVNLQFYCLDSPTGMISTNSPRQLSEFRSRLPCLDR
jgi:hypothetical protein